MKFLASILNEFAVMKLANDNIDIDLSNPDADIDSRDDLTPREDEMEDFHSEHDPETCECPCHNLDKNGEYNDFENDEHNDFVNDEHTFDFKTSPEDFKSDDSDEEFEPI